MSRRVFFSFHYQNDIWRTSIVRNSNIVLGTAAAGFHDASIWEEAKKKGDAAIKKMIDAALVNTSVTVVLIGSKTKGRKYINYEIEKSLERGNGLLGIYVHNIKDRNGKADIKGEKPVLLEKLGINCYNWDHEKFGNWVEAAYENKEVLKKKYNELTSKRLGG